MSINHESLDLGRSAKVDRFSGVVMKNELQSSRAFRAGGSQAYTQETSNGRRIGVGLADFCVGIARLRISRIAAEACIFAVERTAGKFFESAVVHCVIFPMAVTAKDEETTGSLAVFLQP
jgi:hypothetical protein